MVVLKIEIPTTPNFVKTQIGMISVKELGRVEVNELIKMWAKALREKAGVDYEEENNN